MDERRQQTGQQSEERGTSYKLNLISINGDDGPIAIVMSALSRLRASEHGNQALGPGSQKLINQIRLAQAEIRQQLDEDMRKALGI